MKKILLIFTFMTLTLGPAHSQVADVIRAAVKKAIIALDLKIQRLQNKTIWLQNAQKQLENTMSKLKLQEIAGWVQQQEDLFRDYYRELKTVKDLITTWQRVTGIIKKQAALVSAYKRAFGLLKRDTHFTAAEISYMEKVYAGILDASVQNLDEIYMVIKSFSLQMGDAARMKVIEAAAAKIDRNYADLEQFTTQNQWLSLSRSKDEQEILVVKSLYGLP
jgi:DNA repair ATPase RecN